MSIMMDLLAKYSSNFPEKSSGVLRPARELKNVVVTGTTGSLGYYLLVSLLRDAHTGTIYCLNRSGEAKENFWTRYREREDKVEFHEGKVKFLKVSFGDELLGLDKESFNELLEEVDIIIHNAWKVNFKHDLSSFEPQIKGLHALISISLTSPHHPSLYFTSTIGAVSNPHTSLVPEKVITEPIPSNTGGYTQSKWICENILDTVYRKYDLDMNILRIGQVAGPLKDDLGVWNTKEYIPALMKTSKNMGVVPSTLPTPLGNSDVDWIPIDSMADIIVEIIHSPRHLRSTPTDHPGAPVFNLANPTQVPFLSLIPTIQAYFGNNARIVSFHDWLERLGGLDISAPDAFSRYPALKLKAWFMAFDSGEVMGGGTVEKTRFETKRVRRVSGRMRELEGITGSMTRTWLRQWKL